MYENVLKCVSGSKPFGKPVLNVWLGGGKCAWRLLINSSMRVCASPVCEPVAGEPAVGEPVSGEPVAAELAAGEPVAGELAAGEPLASSGSSISPGCAALSCFELGRLNGWHVLGEACDHVL